MIEQRFRDDIKCLVLMETGEIIEINVSPIFVVCVCVCV